MHKNDMQVYKAPAQTDTVVLSYYPLGGNHQNSGARYQEEARLTGCDVAGIVRTGSNTMYYDPQLRHRLSPQHFDELCAEEASSPSLQRLTANYDSIIVRGQSTGSFPSLSIVKSQAIRVTHLAIEDGINTRTRPNGRPKGPIAARLDWLRYSIRESLTMPGIPPSFWIPESEADRSQTNIREDITHAARSIAQFAVEQVHFGDLWRSEYSRSSILEIAARQPKLPIFVQFLGHTAVSTPAGVREFSNQLHAARKKKGAYSAEILTDFDTDAWHHYLLFPQFGADTIRTARAMASYIRQKPRITYPTDPVAL